MVWNDHIIVGRLMQSHKFKCWGKTFQLKQISNKIPTNIQSNIQSVERSCSILDHPKIPETQQFANINIANVLSRFVWLTPMPSICKAHHIVFDSSDFHDFPYSPHKKRGPYVHRENNIGAKHPTGWFDLQLNRCRAKRMVRECCFVRKRGSECPCASISNALYEFAMRKWNGKHSCNFPYP